MRILFISNLYPPYDLGGMEQLCQEIVDRLRQRGHVCHVLTSRYGARDSNLQEDGITRALYLEADVYHYHPLDFFLKRPWQERANRRTLRRALDVFKPDIIFIWGMWNLSTRVAYWAEQWQPGKVAYNIESYWPLDTDPHRVYWRNPSNRKAIRILLWPISKLALSILKAEHYPPKLQFHHVSCCSQYVVDVLTEASVVPPGAIAILNGIDPAPFIAHTRQVPKQNAETLRLLYFGGLMEHKGVHTAIEALGLLQQQGYADKLCLTIVGGGQPEYEDHLHTLTESLGLTDKIHFTGRVPRSDIPRILSEHDIFLFTSIWAEPFGRTIIEAMAAGLAVIGSDVGGSKEIFKLYPEDILFTAGNAEALAGQIKKFVNNPHLVQRLGQAGQDLVREHFTLTRMIEEVDMFLLHIVQS
ncbi:MAG TPA: glycosyltransferase family 4 protein [Anaerolineae bacterium]|nr:glycosyltransferase family 4 protein [Anaerolineae bacterium]HQI83591.1 glycosyltransferase family 4 protein [Anaerolineae bacterium]